MNNKDYRDDGFIKTETYPSQVCDKCDRELQLVQGSNPGGGEIFCTCPDRPWGPPSLLYNGYRVFPGGKEQSGHDADPSPPASAVVMKE